MDSAEWAAVGAVGSAIGGLSAAGLVLWNGAQARRHDRLSVRPILGLGSDWSDERDGNCTLNFTIGNLGFGVAQITSYTVEFRGQRFRGDTANDIQNFRAAMESTHGVTLGNVTTLGPRSLIEVGESPAFSLAKLLPSSDGLSEQAYEVAVEAVYAQVAAAGAELIFRIGYKSMYDEAQPELNTNQTGALAWL